MIEIWTESRKFSNNTFQTGLNYNNGNKLVYLSNIFNDLNPVPSRQSLVGSPTGQYLEVRTMCDPMSNQRDKTKFNKTLLSQVSCHRSRHYAGSSMIANKYMLCINTVVPVWNRENDYYKCVQRELRSTSPNRGAVRHADASSSAALYN